MRKLVSQIDQSINFVTEAPTGYFESRYVCRPNKPYFIVYLSSQSGCSRACRMCHLTATRQIRYVDATVQDLVAQAHPVLQHWDSLRAQHQEMHFNFMARGEPLASKTILTQGSDVLEALQNLTDARGLSAKHLVSTILPTTMRHRSLREVFPTIAPEIYYSVYSVDPEFRSKWLPQALPVELGMEKMRAWQQETGKRMRVHFAFIRGENDSLDSVERLCEMISSHTQEVDVNVVRYNPPDSSSQESPEDVILDRIDMMTRNLPGTVRLIPRVGLDVYASCGVFVNG